LAKPNPYGALLLSKAALGASQSLLSPPAVEHTPSDYGLRQSAWLAVNLLQHLAGDERTPQQQEQSQTATIHCKHLCDDSAAPVCKLMDS
jgi:hypothetical protein